MRHRGPSPHLRHRSLHLDTTHIYSEANLSPKEKALNRFRPVGQTARRYGVVLGWRYLSTAASTCSRRMVSPIVDARSGFA